MLEGTFENVNGSREERVYAKNDFTNTFRIED